MTDDLQIAWLSGLLDGEGWFGVEEFPGRRPKLRVGLSMADLDLVQRAKIAVPTKARIQTRDKSQAPSALGQPRKLQYQVRWNGAQAEEIMLTCYEHFGARRKQKIDECLATPNLSHKEPHGRA